MMLADYVADDDYAEVVSYTVSWWLGTPNFSRFSGNSSQLLSVCFAVFVLVGS
jgi:hypothetical protein